MICALLFFATTINYIDRQVLGILSKDLQAAFHWSEVDYGISGASVRMLVLLLAGVEDRFGTKIAIIALIFWSLAAMSHLGPIDSLGTLGRLVSAMQETFRGN